MCWTSNSTARRAISFSVNAKERCNKTQPSADPNIQGGPEKTAQTLMRYNFSTAGHRVTRFPAKCSETNW